MTEYLNDDENLDAILRHFWGSAYWSDHLRNYKHLNEDAKQYLLAKSHAIDMLNMKLIQAEKTIQYLLAKSHAIDMLNMKFIHEELTNNTEKK